MSIRENVSAAIEPEDRHRVKAIAAAILEHMGFEANGLIDQLIDDEAKDLSYRQLSRAGAAVDLAACIVNYMHEELDPDREQSEANLELLRALQREAGQ